MNVLRRWLPAILASFALALLAALWIVFSPVQLGGQVSYVIITGDSMEPEFLTGDLVIVREAPVYAAGDAVAYKNADIQKFVFHRILRREHDRFVLKGDNNSWVDAYHPQRDELIGKLWIHVPSLGKTVQWARQPLMMSLIAGALGVFFLSTFFSDPARRNRQETIRKAVHEGFKASKAWFFNKVVDRFKRGLPIKEREGRTSSALSIWKAPGHGPKDPGSRSGPGSLDGMLEGLFFSLGLLAFISLLLGVIAFLRPSQRTVADEVAYQHSGKFSYTAVGTPGIYDSGLVRSGEPLFPALNCTMNLSFVYNLTGDDLADISGTREISARVTDETSGWQRTLQLKPASPFDGQTTTTTTRLDLCSVMALTDALEQETNYFPPYYTLLVIPRITITGTTGGRDFQDTYEPPLTFRFDKLHFYVARDDPEVDPLNPSAAGLLAGDRSEANTLPILGFEPEVDGLRLASVIGFLLAAAGMLGLSVWITSMARNDEAYVRLKYGSILIESASAAFAPGDPLIDLASIDDLARLADRKNSMILHETRGPAHYYLVQGDGTTYRFALSERDDGLVEVPLAMAEEELRRAFDRGEFQVYYQPIVSLTDRKITAVEALLRWQHPRRGLVPAKDFMSTAESTGLIQPIGEWMLQVACSQLKDWQDAGIPMTMAVNFAESQLEKGGVNSVSRVLKNTGIDPNTLQVEIPEMGIIHSAHKILPKMKALRDLGIQISIDNFDGQLPVSSIGQYPINNVKIDRLLIQSIGDSENAATIERMAASVRSAGLNVMAVGVETEKQLEQLGSQYYAQAQGILLGNPVPAGDITLLLLKGNRPAKLRSRKAKPVSGGSSL